MQTHLDKQVKRMDAVVDSTEAGWRVPAAKAYRTCTGGPPRTPYVYAWPLPDHASQEGIRNSHGVDKHIGFTDDQLTQRLRDQNNAPSASAYKDLASAQRYIQTVLDDIDNADRIEKWIERVQQRERNNPAWEPNNSKTAPPLAHRKFLARP